MLRPIAAGTSSWATLSMSEASTDPKVGTTRFILDIIEDGDFDRDYSLQSPSRPSAASATIRPCAKRYGEGRMVHHRLTFKLNTWSTRPLRGSSTPTVRSDVPARWTKVIEPYNRPMKPDRGRLVIKKELIDSYMYKNWLSWRDLKVSTDHLQYTVSAGPRTLFHLLLAG